MGYRDVVSLIANEIEKEGGEVSDTKQGEKKVKADKNKSGEMQKEIEVEIRESIESNEDEESED